MASRKAVSQLGFLAQRRPEVCLRIPSQRTVPGCCRCKSHKPLVKYSKGKSQTPPHVKHKMSMTEKVMRRTQHNLENSVTPMLNDEELKHIYSSDLFVFRCDVTTGSQTESAMTLYNKHLSELGILTPNDISNLARALHYKYRSMKDRDRILTHIRTITRDIMSGKVPGHPLAWVHIISCHKEMQNYEEVGEFWPWLEQQKEDHFDSRVVGAMIEVLAFQSADLPKLEYMFRQALREYSVHKDDGGALNSRATRIMLLQGIITARLLNGEWRRAYDALDICLNLHPTWTPSRLFELFIFQRPILEGYIVFLMACRAGRPLSQRVVTYLMKTWIDETKDITALMRILYSYVGCGGKPTYEHMNIVVTALLELIPNFKLLENRTDEELETFKQHSQDILTFVKTFVVAFQEAGVEPDRATYNTIIGQGGKLGNLQLVTATLETMVEAKLPPDLITVRILMATFGMLEQKSQVQASWENLRSMRLQMIKESKANEEERKSKSKRSNQDEFGQNLEHNIMPQWELKDWKALAKGCVYAGIPEYLEQQLELRGHEIPPFMHDVVRKYARNIQLGIQDPKPQPQSLTTAFTWDNMLALHKSLGKAVVDFGRFRAIIRSASAHDFTTTPIEFNELPGVPEGAFSLTMPDEDLQEVYERFTKSRESPFLSNWYKPGADYQEPHSFVSTGMTVGQLRFENWMSINKLLFLAEVREIENINKMLPKSERKKNAVTKEGEEPAEENDDIPAGPETGLPRTRRTLERRAFPSESHAQLMTTRKKTIMKMMKEVEKKMKADQDAWDEIGVFRSALVGGTMEDPLKSLEGQDYLKLRREEGSADVKDKGDS